MKKLNSANKIITKLIRPEILQLKTYQASPTIEQVAREANIPKDKIAKLSIAENPYTDELYEKKFSIRYSLYPDPYCLKLRKAISKYAGFELEWIGCGNGSDELIDLLIALFVSKGEKVIVCPPTFPMYEFFAKIRGVKIKKIQRKKNLQINMNAIRKNITNKTKIIFIDSPGNPSGTVIDKFQLHLLLKKNIVVVIDEAYFEYCGKTVVEFVKRFPNLIVLRTFSKWVGLAGLRIGYMIANPQIINEFHLIKPPYNINSAAQELGIFALKNKNKFLIELNKLLSMRDYILQNLSQFNELTVWTGEGPHIIAKVKSIDCERLVEKLRKNGVLIKPIKQPLLENAVLISIAPRQKIDLLVNKLKTIIR